MDTESKQQQGLEFHSLSPQRWPDLEALFGKRGACGGCWCIWWRLRRSEFERQKGPGNREDFKHLVEAGEATGILAYSADTPIDWCSVGPRDRYPVLDRSRILKRVDAQPVWSVICFFLAGQHRGTGLMLPLLRSAVRYATEQGARIIEGYPVDRRGTADAFVWTGPVPTFQWADFEEREWAASFQSRPETAS